MGTLKQKIKKAFLFCLSLGIYGIGNSQDYYQGGNNGDWRKMPSSQSAQKDNEDKPGYLPSAYTAINFGFANPTGGFSQSYGGGYGGYASKGSVYSFDFSVPIGHSGFGLAFLFGEYNNTYNLTNYINYLNNSNINYAYGPLDIPDNNVYSESSILGGLFYTYPLGRLSLDSRIMIGAILNSLPEQAYGQIDAQGDIWEYDLQTSYPTSFAIDAGIGVRFMVAKIGSRQLCLLANVDYLYSNVTYSTVQYEATLANNSSNQIDYSNTINGHLPISLFNITFGIGYQFGGGSE